MFFCIKMQKIATLAFINLQTLYGHFSRQHKPNLSTQVILRFNTSRFAARFRSVLWSPSERQLAGSRVLAAVVAGGRIRLDHLSSPRRVRLHQGGNTEAVAELEAESESQIWSQICMPDC